MFNPEYETDRLSLPKPLNRCIIRKKNHPNGIYLILKGEVLVGNSTCEYEYFRLKPGQYFGDTSLMFGKLTTYSYYYDAGQSINLLKITASDFKELALAHWGSAKVMEKRAEFRRLHFKRLKTKALLKILRQRQVQTNHQKARDILELLTNDLQEKLDDLEDTKTQKETTRQSFKPKVQVERIETLKEFESRMEDSKLSDEES